MDPIERAAALLRQCGEPGSVTPPTTLYNEGWLLRLVLEWYSRHRPSNAIVPFASDATWYSEALLPSRFFKNSKPEGWTHADAIIGHFDIRRPRGDAVLSPSATQFLVIEAKMGSPLSAGTKHAPTFNQATRNVACMLHMLHQGKHRAGVIPDLGFLVFAPKRRIESGHFISAIDKAGIVQSIRERDGGTNSDHESWCTMYVGPEVDRMRIEVIAWEDLLNEVTSLEPAYGSALMAFYGKCCGYNGL